jgi:hypothetical protein
LDQATDAQATITFHSLHTRHDFSGLICHSLTVVENELCCLDSIRTVHCRLEMWRHPGRRYRSVIFNYGKLSHIKGFPFKLTAQRSERLPASEYEGVKYKIGGDKVSRSFS